MVSCIKKQNGFYIDPSVEFIVGRLNGVSYDANIAGGGSMHVNADGINSAVGRLGFGIGKETENLISLQNLHWLMNFLVR